MTAIWPIRLSFWQDKVQQLSQIDNSLPNIGGLDASVIILYFFPGSSSNSLTWSFCQ